MNYKSNISEWLSSSSLNLENSRFDSFSFFLQQLVCFV